MDLIGPLGQSAREYRFILVLFGLGRLADLGEEHSRGTFLSNVLIPNEILIHQGTSFMSCTLCVLYKLLGSYLHQHLSSTKRQVSGAL